MFDEHPFLFRDVEKQLVKLFFILAAQGAERRLGAVLEFDGFWKFLEFKLDGI